jgi:hypothetical protein
MAGRSWLFVKELRSTWVERPQRRSLRVAGPGPARDRLEFATEHELEEFLTTLAERLVADGWILWHVDHDRRRAGRRRHPRISPDRRAES